MKNTTLSARCIAYQQSLTSFDANDDEHGNSLATSHQVNRILQASNPDLHAFLTHTLAPEDEDGLYSNSNLDAKILEVVQGSGLGEWLEASGCSVVAAERETTLGSGCGSMFANVKHKLKEKVG